MLYTIKQPFHLTHKFWKKWNHQKLLLLLFLLYYPITFTVYKVSKKNKKTIFNDFFKVIYYVLLQQRYKIKPSDLSSHPAGMLALFPFIRSMITLSSLIEQSIMCDYSYTNFSLSDIIYWLIDWLDNIYSTPTKWVKTKWDIMQYTKIVTFLSVHLVMCTERLAGYK